MVPSLPRLKIPFPDWIAGLAFDHVTDYEDPAKGGQPGAGISLAYMEDITVADIYEYTFGISNIGTGIELPAVGEEFHRSLWELSQAAVQVIPAGEPDVLTVPGKFPLDWLCAACWLSKADPHEMQVERWFESYICLTSWKNIFIKIRLSHYLGQAFEFIIQPNIGRLDPAMLLIANQLLLDFVGIVSDLLRGVQTRQSIHTQLEEERRRQKAKDDEAKKRRQEEIRIEIQEGKRCPKCEFKYGWDGVCCGHCHYRLPAEKISRRQLEQAKRIAERRAREKAEREAALLEKKKAEEARIAKAIKEGKLCPQCGFSYKWDGIHCGHCNYRSTDKAR